ncbi:uncharacterized protein METZ01_LOCUS123128 [marine metagenome]|uniref:Uncharacterized protein n=1 Tax=marine metagenome TaxID=408172 RepID=A0A381XZT2_9ZZZZ
MEVARLRLAELANGIDVHQCLHRIAGFLNDQAGLVVHALDDGLVAVELGDVPQRQRPEHAVGHRTG